MLLGLLTMGTIFVKIKVSKLKMEAKKIGVFWWMIPMSSIIHLYPHKNKVLQFPKKYLKIQWILSNQHVLLIGSIRNSKWKRHNQRIVISRSASYRKLALKRMFPSCFFEKRFIFFFFFFMKIVGFWLTLSFYHCRSGHYGSGFMKQISAWTEKRLEWGFWCWSYTDCVSIRSGVTIILELIKQVFDICGIHSSFWKKGKINEMMCNENKTEKIFGV